MRSRHALVSSTGETSFFCTARLAAARSSKGSSLAELFAGEGMAILRIPSEIGLVFKSRQTGRQLRGSFLARTLVAGAFEDQRQGTTALLPFAGNFRASGIELSLVAGG
jgi:hypothetical protein